MSSSNKKLWTKSSHPEYHKPDFIAARKWYEYVWSVFTGLVIRIKMVSDFSIWKLWNKELSLTESVFSSENEYALSIFW